jgi:hypothetical protein
MLSAPSRVRNCFREQDLKSRALMAGLPSQLDSRLA